MLTCPRLMTVTFHVATALCNTHPWNIQGLIMVPSLGSVRVLKPKRGVLFGYNNLTEPQRFIMSLFKPDWAVNSRNHGTPNTSPSHRTVLKGEVRLEPTHEASYSRVLSFRLRCMGGVRHFYGRVPVLNTGIMYSITPGTKHQCTTHISIVRNRKSGPGWFLFERFCAHFSVKTADICFPD